MPLYTWLRPRAGDARTELESKVRASAAIRRLRVAFREHVAAAGREDAVPHDEAAPFLRLATWNLREFDSSSYGYRLPEAKAYIAEILSNFHLVALQEIRRDLRPLQEVLRLLGPSWSYIATDVTEGTSGNRERMAFVYDTDRVWFRNVAGELTLPRGHKVTDPFGERFRIQGGAELDLPDGEAIVSPTGLKTDTLASGQTKLEQDVEIPLPEGTRVRLPPGTTVRFARNARVPITDDGAIAIAGGAHPTLPEAAEFVLPPDSLVGGSEQFARTPFVVSFQAGWLKLNLATVHIYYGSGDAGMARRQEEIRRLTALLADRAADDNDSDAEAFFIALGDFNIVGRDHATMQALTSHGFVVPAALQSVPGSNVRQDKHYDQIALWQGESSRRRGYARLVARRAGVFDFFDSVFRSEDEATYRPFMGKPGSAEDYRSFRTWRTHQMSDHLPMWVDLGIDFTDAYLDEVDAELRARLDG